uniref:Uncharacterized protein n=1 Tax=Asterionellopsis glacialis TaxID=33640 RepID=A0A7S0KYB5_9STRA|mmetsp:Transcript_9/g.13  ORF Transcript_9/g.13 Transcript_9/m.13 type:complete len:183 (+) Transcript_9:96-644(+)
MKFSVLILALTASAANAYSVSNSRRQVFQRAFGSAAAVAVASPQLAQALEQCPSGANNCVRTSWSPPSGTSKADAAKAVRAAIEAYPQEGQNDVDGGGWSIAEDDLDGSGKARVEYRSSGKKFFAKAFNGGKPFVDDLQIEIKDSGNVEIKSSSRVGDSDFGVNKSRVSYLAAGLQSQGWGI